jgi:hypothetical protein
MEITTTVIEGSVRGTALMRALTAYNASNPTLTVEQYLQKLVDAQLDNLAQSYAVARIAPFDFLSRFTPAERANIRTAAQGNAAIADYIAMAETAPSINLTSELTTTGVNALEAAGLIGAGRAAEILAY